MNFLLQKDVLPILKFENYIIRFLEIEDSKKIVDFYKKNKNHLSRYETIQIDYYKEEFWNEKSISNKKEFYKGDSCCLAIFYADILIGIISFTCIIHGLFQSCFLGYKICIDYQKKGIMKNSLKISIEFVFNELNLHRISANYQEHNIRSAKLLNSLGFEIEGRAPSYLLINGKWQDHILTALINKSWKESKT